MKYVKNRQAIIKDITLSGFMFALFIVVKFAFKEINLINGYSPQIQLVVLVLGYIVSNTIVLEYCFYF